MRLVLEQHLGPAAAPVRAIVEAYRAAGGDARVVGGAVRDALLGCPLTEVDLAGTLAPPEAEKALQNAGFRVVPTGLVHGTLTAVRDGRGFEVTSLRRDVDPDGRHARVAFGGSWETDAARRDFTVNALYLAVDGEVYDYGTGIDDLRAGRLRFIGDPARRLAEDYLRLLRLFRFMAQLRGPEGRPFTPAPDGLAAAREAACHLVRLSRERIGHEVRKLLEGPFVVRAWEALLEAGAGPFVLEGAIETTALADLLRQAPEASWIVRLAALLGTHDATAAEAALRLSKVEAQKLAALARRVAALRAGFTARDLRHWAFRDGLSLLSDALRLVGHPEVLASVNALPLRPFPLTGGELLTLGFTPGPALGACLEKTKIWWIDQNFAPDADACRRYALACRDAPDV
jgi:tRNA nucleotidyltransferase/poly(A) polymerase